MGLRPGRQHVAGLDHDRRKHLDVVRERVIRPLFRPGVVQGALYLEKFDEGLRRPDGLGAAGQSRQVALASIVVGRESRGAGQKVGSAQLAQAAVKIDHGFTLSKL